MWLFYSLLAPLFFAIVHVMDAHCVDHIFEKPWMGVVTSALASLLIFILLPFIAPFVTWEQPEITYVVLAFLSGVLIQASQGFYFKALSYSEAGIIAAYWNFIPAFLPIFSFIIFRDVLQVPQYVGIIILILSSVSLCLIDSNFHTRWNSFFLMLGASLLQVAAYLIEDRVFEKVPFFMGFLFITAGLVFTGTLPLLLKKVRNSLKRNFHKLHPAVSIFIAIEIANLCALAAAQKGIDLGIPSLVAAVETTIPSYTFLLSLVFLYVYPKFGDRDTFHRLPVKLSLVGIMVIGVWMVS